MLYLYFIGNKYSIFYDIGKRYCFESVISLYNLLSDDKDIIYLKNIVFGDYIFFNSLSITENKNAIFIDKYLDRVL